MEWCEDLPDGCPENGAEDPNGRTFYRVGENNPQIENDFYSHRKKFDPKRKFNTSECIARSLSILNSIAGCERIKKLPSFKNKTTHLIEMVLHSKDGLVKKTGRDSAHYSWWRTNEYNISDGIIVES